MRLGWNDGKTEDFAFTAIDRLASGGVSLTGARWRRPADTVATAFTAAGLSGVHALYLAHGGLDFLIGDGKLNYAPEYIWESYYSAQVVKGFLRELRRAAYQQSCIQSRPRARFGRSRCDCTSKEQRAGNEDRRKQRRSASSLARDSRSPRGT